jgi:hypothetical protein
MSASQSTVLHEDVAFRFVERSIAELCGISEQGGSVCVRLRFSHSIVALPLDYVGTRAMVADPRQS